MEFSQQEQLLPSMTEEDYDFYSIDTLEDLENNPSIMLLPHVRCRCNKTVGHYHDEYFDWIRNNGDPVEFFELKNITRPCCRFSVAHPQVFHTGGEHYNLDAIMGKKQIDTRAEWVADPVTVVDDVNNPYAINRPPPVRTPQSSSQINMGPPILQLPTSSRPSNPVATNQASYQNPLNNLSQGITPLSRPNPVKGLPQDVQQNINEQLAPKYGGGYILGQDETLLDDPAKRGDIAFGTVYSGRFYTGEDKDVGMGYNVPILGGTYKT